MYIPCYRLAAGDRVRCRRLFTLSGKQTYGGYVFGAVVRFDTLSVTVLVHTSADLYVQEGFEYTFKRSACMVWVTPISGHQLDLS